VRGSCWKRFFTALCGHHGAEAPGERIWKSATASSGGLADLHDDFASTGSIGLMSEVLEQKLDAQRRRSHEAGRIAERVGGHRQTRMLARGLSPIEMGPRLTLARGAGCATGRYFTALPFRTDCRSWFRMRDVHHLYRSLRGISNASGMAGRMRLRFRSIRSGEACFHHRQRPGFTEPKRNAGWGADHEIRAG